MVATALVGVWTFGQRGSESLNLRGPTFCSAALGSRQAENVERTLTTLAWRDGDTPVVLLLRQISDNGRVELAKLIYSGFVLDLESILNKVPGIHGARGHPSAGASESEQILLVSNGSSLALRFIAADGAYTKFLLLVIKDGKVLKTNVFSGEEYQLQVKPGILGGKEEVFAIENMLKSS